MGQLSRTSPNFCLCLQLLSCNECYLCGPPQIPVCTYNCYLVMDVIFIKRGYKVEISILHPNYISTFQNLPRCTWTAFLTFVSNSFKVSPCNKRVHLFCLLVWIFLRQNFTEALGLCVAIATIPNLVHNQYFLDLHLWILQLIYKYQYTSTCCMHKIFISFNTLFRMTWLWLKQ